MIDLILIRCGKDSLFGDLWKMVVPDLNTISWNVQGAGNKNFLNTLKDLIIMHDPAILVLLKTRISGEQADKVCEKIGFDGILPSEAMGFKGSVWILWKGDQVSITEIDVQQQFISISMERVGEAAFIEGGFMAETKSLDERTVRPDALRRRCEKFNHWIKEMGFLDMSFSGQQFTWSHGRDSTTKTCARLDRGLCNTEWQDLFDSAAIRHLAANQSDHTPLLVEPLGLHFHWNQSKPFRFQAGWLLHKNFKSFLASLG
ncbi:hypothetical protein V2J09_008503 [Rumex salicifolius]